TATAVHETESSKNTHENGRTSSGCGSFGLVSPVIVRGVFPCSAPVSVNMCVAVDAAGPNLRPSAKMTLAAECDGRNDTATGIDGNSHPRTGMLSPAYSTAFQTIRRTEVAFTRNAL